MDNGECLNDNENEGNGTELRGKKRKRSPSKWKRNVKKIAKLKGEEHKDYKDRIIPALTTGPSCR